MTAVAAPPARPAARAWHRASHGRDCPICNHRIKEGHLVAHVDTGTRHAHVCPNCTSSPAPRRRR